ncbi:MAG: glycosyltransferase, partial [Bauldia sp.]
MRSPPGPLTVAATSAPPDVSIVVPVFDERDALPGLIDEIDAALAPLGRSSELIFVDDGSTDGSG